MPFLSTKKRPGAWPRREWSPAVDEAAGSKGGVRGTSTREVGSEADAVL